MANRNPSEWRPCLLDPEHPGRMIQASILAKAGPDARFYCNRDCRVASTRRPRPECVLPGCTLPACQDGVYCGAAHYKEHLVERNTTWATCAWDSTHPPIRLTPSRAKKSERFFCDLACRLAYQKANATDPKVRGPMGRPRVDRVIVACEYEGCDQTMPYYAQRVPERPLCQPHRKLLGSKIPRGDSNVPCELGEDCCHASGGQPRTFYRRPDSTKRFCSTECRQRWEKRNEVTLVCPYENHEFTLPAGLAKNRVYCGSDHAWFAQIVRVRPDRSRNGRPGLEDRHGYIWVYEPTHPKANRSGRVQEHIAVAWETHGPLPPGTEVHHDDRVKDNNDPKNLIPETPKGHARLTARQRETDRQRSLRLAEVERELAALQDELRRRGEVRGA